MARNFYAIILIFLYLRTIQYLRYWEKAGVMSIVLLRMLPDVKIFFSLVMIISFGFGAAFAILLPGRMDKPFSYAFSSSPLWFPFWGLYGEFDRHDFEEYVEDEMPTRLISLVLMWLYMLITTIVLVNLLIAQMSETYAKEMRRRRSRGSSSAPSSSSSSRTRRRRRCRRRSRRSTTSPSSSATIRRRPAEPGFRVVTRAAAAAAHEGGGPLPPRRARARPRDAGTVDVKVDTLGEGMGEMVRANCSRFESLTGRVERLEEKLSKKLDAIEKALKRQARRRRRPHARRPAQARSSARSRRRRRLRTGRRLVAQKGDSPLKKESDRINSRLPTVQALGRPGGGARAVRCAQM